MVNVYVGYRGFWNLVLLWPIAIWVCTANPSAWETVKTLSADGILHICAMAFVSVLTTCMLTLGISWTSPVYMRLGATLASPSAILWDIHSGYSPGWKCYFGSFLTIVGFVFCNMNWPHADRCNAITSAALAPKFMLPPAQTTADDDDNEHNQRQHSVTELPASF